MIALLTRGALGLAAAMAVATAGAADNVRVFEADSFRDIVTSHQGKPFVVVVWSIDCDYCLPSFKALAQAQRRRQLDVVTIATDRADDAEAVRYVARKIRSAGLASQAWAFGSAPAEQLRYAIDPKWRGEMPRSYWFDSKGNMLAHSGMLTPSVVAELARDPHTRRAQE
jgi:thiol-disulfide isomerase/thioredoxin